MPCSLPRGTGGVRAQGMAGIAALYFALIESRRIWAISRWVDVLGCTPSRLTAVPNGAAPELGSGGNAGNARMAPGVAASVLRIGVGSTYAQFRSAAAWAMVALYWTTVLIMLIVSATEITCGSEQSSVVGVPPAARATSGAPKWNGT